MADVEGSIGGQFVEHVPTTRGEVLGQPGASTYDVALFVDNLWWTPEQVAGLVGQRPLLTDEYRETRVPGVITQAWKANGMVCVRLEPLTGDNDE